MKLEKHRYEDVIILRFTGEFDTFNLPAFSERIDRIVDAGDNQFVLDLRLLKFINSAALGYLIKTSKRIKDAGGGLVLARPSKFIKKTLSTLGLDDVFQIFESVEGGVMHFRTGDDVGEITLAGGEYDEALTGSVPILFRPQDGGDAKPNQVGRIVTLYEDGLLFRYEPEAGGSDPVQASLTKGAVLKLKFRQPFAIKEYYFEMNGEILEANQMAGGDDDDTPVSAVRVRYQDIKPDDRTHLEQFVRDQESWKTESQA
ncbi:MAG: STAS domain-containing protein [Planctomycetota bacterium]|nr:STAS domain-containing protein [Planctomycetota bacterium]